MMKPRHVLLPALCLAILGLSGCVTTYITPVAVATPTRVDKTSDQSVASSSKIFTLPNDWQWGPWIIKTGATIVFNEDGTGSFSARVFAQHATTTEELHFQSIQYGKDGNRLFTFPGSDTGYPMTIRRAFTDYPYDVRFAFDPRFFRDIDSVKFFARLRLDADHLGSSAAKRTSFIGTTVFDQTGRPPKTLPAVP